LQRGNPNNSFKYNTVMELGKRLPIKMDKEGFLE
jgi:hypothetical protein